MFQGLKEVRKEGLKSRDRRKSIKTARINSGTFLEFRGKEQKLMDDRENV